MKKTIYVIAIALVTLTACSTDKKDKNALKKSSIEVKSDNEHNHSNHDYNNAEMKNNDGHDHEHSNMEKTTSHTEKSIQQSNTKNPATTPIIDAYLQIKNGLVATDKAAATKGAKALLTAFNDFDMSKLSGDTHKEYMEIVENAKEQAEHIAKSPMEHQREHFENLSTDIADLVALLGTEKTLYQDYCPMAKASWLSEVKDIKNPYYGDKMLTCGSIKKQIN
jgi:hypothetical protein